MCHALLLALTLLHPLATSAAQPLTGKITGVVVLGDEPLPGATVTVTYAGTAHTFVTDLDGRFAFAGIPLGAVVQLSADMESFQPLKKSVALTAAAASRDLTLAMKLREGEMITVACAAADPLPHSMTVFQSDVDKLPIGRSIENIVDLLAGTH
jgi:hypothetical protein